LTSIDNSVILLSYHYHTENKGAHVGKIAISLPDDLLEDLERERKASGKSRSELVRQALEAMLSAERKRIKQYIEGYKRYPETEEEIDWVKATSKTAFAASSWEDDPSR
jgi:metal-responsive CopG/Arc/MetJ family transcriptional regulator